MDEILYKSKCFLSVVLLSFVIASSAFGEKIPQEFDVLIENGFVIDGTGSPGKDADVGIVGKHIVAIGELSGMPASTRIDAKGQVVSPGFVDMHSHASYTYFLDSRALSKISQGITLEVEGEGYSVAPLNDEMATGIERVFADRPEFKWRSLDDFLSLLEASPATINFATYLGSANVREMVVGLNDRPVTSEELDEMRAITDQAMRDGALGLYPALMYTPDRFNSTDELLAMAKVVGQYGGLYQTHPRSESNALKASMNEIERIAREAAIPVHITHMKVSYTQNWGRMKEVVSFIERLRADGIRATADIYPYQQAAGELTALLPPWAQDGGREAVLKRLNDPVIRERIKKELIEPADDWENEYFGTEGGPAGITLIETNKDHHFARYWGKTLLEISEAEVMDPRDVMLDLITGGYAAFTSIITGEDDIRLGIQQPWVAIGTDGLSIAPNGPLSDGLPHPRAYGTFPKFFGTYVRDLGLVSLSEAVRRSTSLPANILGIKDRGILREGYFADIVIFNPDTIADKATYANPHQLSVGVDTVLVNGGIVYANGAATDARPGMVIRGPGYESSK